MKAVASVIKGSTQGQSNEDKGLPRGISNQESNFIVESGKATRCSGLRIKWERRRCGQITPLRSLARREARD